MKNRIANALTVDVEDYFQVSAFEHCIDRASWDSMELRVENNVARILDLFDEFGAKGTFFTLGWIAERAPGLVRRIADRGHDIACHGYGHQLVYDIGPDRFREDIRRAKAILEDQSGKAVTGYRAPSYSIVDRSLWALDILIEEGFAYDSSIFPIFHDRYGIPDAPRFPHDIERENGTIREFPLTTKFFSAFGKEMNFPVAGGGYLRLFPVSLIERAFKSINRDGNPVVLYFHPWEIDPGQPRIANTGWKSRFRHYVNLDKTESKLRTLLGSFHFAPMASVLGVGGGGHGS
ncbi:XrtA system polysaccharide deacetylase [Desulfovibrio sp. Fe33]|uniref:XrtA system polysaccharide deacetylase n=1 Tax=Desulfovibrio sp. Fe33 TaxID=3020842 RepID=UPI00234D2EF2|nr:XrtA system polysaccharide deacetylase [Desulfovibrio sp. Fe33]